MYDSQLYEDCSEIIETLKITKKGKMRQHLLFFFQFADYQRFCITESISDLNNSSLALLMRRYDSERYKCSQHSLSFSK